MTLACWVALLAASSIAAAGPIQPTPTPAEHRLSGGFGRIRAGTTARPAANSPDPAAGQSLTDAVRAAAEVKKRKEKRVRVTISNETLVTDEIKGRLTTSSVRIPTPAAPAAASGQPTSGSPVETGGKSGVGRATVDQPDFKHSYYVDRMLARIGMNWFKPVDSLPISPMIRFRIEHDGTISDPQVERSSRLSFVDKAALRAVMASSPLPPLPQDFRGKSLGVHLIFE